MYFLHFELAISVVNLFNVPITRGINVLDSRSELEKAMAKHRQATEQKHKEADKEEDDAVFKKMMAERARRLEKVSSASGETGP